jgi:hypothetical protein
LQLVVKGKQSLLDLAPLIRKTVLLLNHLLLKLLKHFKVFSFALFPLLALERAICDRGLLGGEDA